MAGLLEPDADDELDRRLRAYRAAVHLRKDEELRAMVVGEAQVFVDAIEGLIANRRRDQSAE